MTAAFVTGLVLAAGGSKRLGRPKQLLPYGAITLLGGGAHAVRAQVDLHCVTVVENDHFGDGCSSSIAVALKAVDPRCEVLVLMLGDQPGVRAATIGTLLAGRGDSPLAACAYSDGRGHPLAFAREMFAELHALHGDKGVWKLLDRRASALADVRIEGPIPHDVDTWEDYELVTRPSGRA
jgi:molybdenum cofactor cytidylyltransferase